MKKTSYYQRFMAMTDAERDAEVARFGKEDLTPGKPLSPEMRKQWSRAIRRGRPAKPKEKRVARALISLPPELLRQADTYAHEHGLSRAALVAQGLRMVVAA